MGDRIRLDVGRFRSKPQRTPQGFLKVPANLTRTGVLTYASADGSQIRELRHPDEVFKADSLESMRLAPMTDRHPATLVSPSNVRSLQVGIVSDVRRDGSFVAGDLVIQSQDMINKVNSREVCEISAGYQCEIEETPGTFEGERFDRIQRDIVYNHVAGGPTNWGRAGNDVGIRLDGIASHLIPLIGVEYIRLDQESLAPSRDMDREKLQALREQRSERYGIEILESGSNLTFPADRPTSLEDYADPVNLKYPLTPAGRARNARSRFKQAADEYQNRRSRAVIHERIVARLLEIGAKPSIDDSDPLDRLLPKGLKEKAEKTRRGDSRRTKGKTMDVDLIAIRIDDLDFEVPKTAHGAIQKALGARDSKVKDLTAKLDGLQGKHDALVKEHEGLKTKLDAATKPEAVQAAVDARLALVSAASKVLGDEVKLDSMTDREIKIAVVTKHDSEFKADGASDEYLEGRYVGALAAAPAADNSTQNRDDAARALANQQLGKKPDGSKDERIDSADAQRAKSMNDLAEAWRQPLRATSTR